MLGSLYFSEILHLPPCVLCWYQRIALYPLVVLIPIGLWRKISDLPYLILGLTLPGLVISVYHNLLYWKILPESFAPCVQGVSCTTRFVEFGGFITIPFLALLAFVVINMCMLGNLYLKRKMVE
jgi:disulfide bond formation protein DsbB